jgi:hypothetical protein
MGEALPSSIQAIVANRINNSNNSLCLIDRIKADHEEQRRKLKNRIISRQVYHEPTSSMNKPATREWQHNGKSPQKKTDAAKDILSTTNRYSTLEIDETEEEPEEEEDERPSSTRIPVPFTHKTKEAEDFLKQNYEYQQAIGIASPIVKTTLALKYVKGDELESWKADLEQWVDALDMDTDDIPLVWDLFVTELKEQARRNKSNAARQQLTNLRMEEGQLKAYIDKFEELAEQTGLTQANPITTHTFIKGLTASLQNRINAQPIYGYRVARARALQEDQKYHAVAEALRARQQQRQRLIDRIQRRHEPVQDDEPRAKSPTSPTQPPMTANIPSEAPVERQHPVTEAIRTKRQRPTSAEYPSQPEDEPTATNPNNSLNKRQRMTGDLPIEEQPAKKQEEPNVIPREEPRAAKRPIAADYFDHKDELTTISSDEPSTKKQRLASTRVSEPIDTDHIRSSNTDIYISARKSMMVRTYVHSKNKQQNGQIAVLRRPRCAHRYPARCPTILPLGIRRKQDDLRLPLVCSGTTQYRLEKGMDRSHTVAHYNPSARRSKSNLHTLNQECPAASAS